MQYQDGDMNPRGRCFGTKQIYSLLWAVQCIVMLRTHHCHIREKPWIFIQKNMTSKGNLRAGLTTLTNIKKSQRFFKVQVRPLISHACLQLH